MFDGHDDQDYALEGAVLEFRASKAGESEQRPSWCAVPAISISLGNFRLCLPPWSALLLSRHHFVTANSTQRSIANKCLRTPKERSKCNSFLPKHSYILVSLSTRIRQPLKIVGD